MWFVMDKGVNLAETGDGERVAAAQAEVGVLGDVGELILGVAKGFGDGGAVLGGGAFGGGAVVLGDLVVDGGGVHFGWRYDGGLWMY